MAAVTDYATLKSFINDVVDRAGDTDFTAQNDTFIGLAEASFSPKLLSRRMETTTTLTTASTGAVALPSDYFRARALYATVNGVSINLPLITPQQEQILYPVATGLSPAYAKIVGSTLTIFPAAAQDVTLDYLQRFTGLSSGKNRSLMTSTNGSSSPAWTSTDTGNRPEPKLWFATAM